MPNFRLAFKLNLSWIASIFYMNYKCAFNFSYLLAGLTGQSGLLGPRGIDGRKGDKGPRGDSGPMGLPGPMGFRGDSGTSGPMGKPGYSVSVAQFPMKVKVLKVVTNI